MDDAFGAFLPGARDVIAPIRAGVLDGLRIAVKDLIAVAGTVTGGGNPDWAAAHEAETRHAWAVRRLLEAGASVCGKTITDELAFSLEGENQHYGTPVNPRCPDCLPGGSSSGSAVAVASGQADAALGTDTGGSVRIPAAFCGVFGFRPTHGRIRLDGVMPFAPDYDTVGWFAATADVLRRVGMVLLQTPLHAQLNAASQPKVRLRSVQDAFAMTDARSTAVLQPAIDRLQAHAPVTVFGGDPDQWSAAYQVLQNAQIRTTLGPWIARHAPHFGSNIAPRFAAAFTVDAEAEARHTRWRMQASDMLDQLLADGNVLVLPTSPCAALPKTADSAERADFYRRALAMNAIAGHAGLPQLTIPAGTVDARPVGLSFIGARGTDEVLLAHAPSWTCLIDS